MIGMIFSVDKHAAQVGILGIDRDADAQVGPDLQSQVGTSRTFRAAPDQVTWAARHFLDTVEFRLLACQKFEVEFVRKVEPEAQPR